MVLERLHAAFQRAASSVPAYRCLLHEHGVDPASIVDYDTFATLLPDSDQGQYLRTVSDRPAVCGRGDWRPRGCAHELGSRRTILVRPEHPPATRRCACDDRRSARRGVRRSAVAAPSSSTACRWASDSSSAAATVATTSVREDMATALVTTFGSHYEQIVIVADPLFIRRLLDYAHERGVDWRRHRLGVDHR